jgi:acyl-CoA synthetase (AMP-forming)/AMP-acid ligase II
MGSRAALRQRWYDEGWFGDLTLDAALRAGAQQFPDARLVFHSDLRPSALTLAEADERAGNVAAALSQLGLQRGDVLAVQLPNWAELAVAYYAAARLGLVLLPIIHIYGPAEVGFILRESRAKALVVPDEWRGIDYADRVSRLGPTPDLGTIIVVGDNVHSGGRAWAELEAEGGRAIPPAAIGADDVCALSYTSGTTSDPKGVMHSANTILAEIKSQTGMTGSGRQVMLSPYPSGHIGGIISLISPFVTGSSCVFMDAWDPTEAAALIAEHRVTVSSGTPYFLMTLLDVVEQGTHDVSSLERYATGGAGVPPAVVERAAAQGWFCFRSYGSTEHPTITVGYETDAPDTWADTDGRLTPGSQMRIVDDEGHDVPPGTDGEVWSIGPEVFVGYRSGALDDESFDPDGWFRTGDIGRVDDAGFLTITDRKKDIIIRGGENISSKEVEDVLARHPSVAEAAVVAAPDPLYGERACAFVILRPGASLSMADVQAHFAEAGVAKQKTPERLEVRDELPRNATGKVKKFELRDRLRAEAAET